MTAKTKTVNEEGFVDENPDELVKFIAKTLSDKNGEEIVSLDLRGITTIADYFVVCNGLSEVHTKALSEEVEEKVRKAFGEKPWRKEGLDTRRWIILDYVNIVIHIFKKEYREHYAIEKMWGDAKTEYYKD
jgi:ribosome-associated protein